jgi:hypothetical protein
MYFIYGLAAKQAEWTALGILLIGALLLHGAVRYAREKGYLTTQTQDEQSDYGD